MNSCMFCGHREILNKFEIQNKTEIAIEYLIANDNVSVFYSGGMGDFDMICENCVRKIKKYNNNLKLYLVMPYLTKNINKNPEYYYSMYDEIIIPDMGDVFPKQAILKRNRWMVDKSDYMLAHIERNYGGAYKTMLYAIKSDNIKITKL